jgi:hypothetical protein
MISEIIPIQIKICMKRSMLSVALLGAMLAGISNASAQGQITFANSSPASLVTTNSPLSSNVATKGTYKVALYWGTVGSTEAQLVSIATAGSYPVNGRFNGGVVTTPNGTPPGGQAVFEVKGWTGNYADYETAYAAAQTDSVVLVGTSGMWTQATAAGGTASPVFMNFPGLVLGMPEPSTYALTILGLLAFAWKPLRRRMLRK